MFLNQIPTGTVFTALVSSIHRGTFLRTFNGIVMLDDPARTWTVNENTNLAPKIEEYIERNVELRFV